MKIIAPNQSIISNVFPFRVQLDFNATFRAVVAQAGTDTHMDPMGTFMSR